VTGEPAPDPESYVVLDIGADVGALVLYCPAELDGAEIEISRAVPAGSVRTHSQVRMRKTGEVRVFAAVYPGLNAGTYTIWSDAATPAGTVVIEGGQVTTWQHR
jgi:hypothetical protein